MCGNVHGLLGGNVPESTGRRRPRSHDLVGEPLPPRRAGSDRPPLARRGRSSPDRRTDPRCIASTTLTSPGPQRPRLRGRTGTAFATGGRLIRQPKCTGPGLGRAPSQRSRGGRARRRAAAAVRHRRRCPPRTGDLGSGRRASWSTNPYSSRLERILQRSCGTVAIHRPLSQGGLGVFMCLRETSRRIAFGRGGGGQPRSRLLTTTGAAGSSFRPGRRGSGAESSAAGGHLKRRGAGAPRGGHGRRGARRLARRAQPYRCTIANWAPARAQAPSTRGWIGDERLPQGERRLQAPSSRRMPPTAAGSRRRRPQSRLGSCTIGSGTTPVNVSTDRPSSRDAVVLQLAADNLERRRLAHQRAREARPYAQGVRRPRGRPGVGQVGHEKHSVLSARPGSSASTVDLADRNRPPPMSWPRSAPHGHGHLPARTTTASAALKTRGPSACHALRKSRPLPR